VYNNILLRMRSLSTILFLCLLTTACQNDSASEILPDFINFAAVENNADDAANFSRSSEAYRARVHLQKLGNEEIVVIADDLESGRSLAYILQRDIPFVGEATVMDKAWVIYLQDHLLLIDERSDRRLKLSIGNRPLDTEVVSESASFTQEIKGVGLARYPDQSIRPEQLSGASSYLELVALQ